MTPACDDEETLSDLIDEFCDVKDICTSFEGDRGLAGITQIVEAIGYKESGFKWGSPIEKFLSDNSGAAQALIEWIKEQDIPEWRCDIESFLPEKDEDDDGDSDDN